MSKNLDNIISSAAKIADATLWPTTRELTQINCITLKFIKDKGLIVYGGTAINALVQLKGDSIYDADKLVDYDVISPDNYRHSIELCNIFFNNHYNYVERRDAIHENTYSIFVDMSTNPVADITYIPPTIFQIIPFIEIDGVKYIHPEYQLIDIYKSFTNITNSYRWDEKKEYFKYAKLIQHYPIQPISAKITKPIIDLSNIIKLIDSFISSNKKNRTVYAGIHTYNSMLQFIGANDKIIPLYYIDVYTTDPIYLTNKIAELFGPTASIIKRSALVDHYPVSYSVIINNTPIFNAYDLTDYYINTTIIQNRPHISYHYLLLFLHVALLQTKLMGNSYNDIIRFMLFNIMTEREKYLINNNVSGIGSDKKTTPINIFNFEFDEIPISLMDRIMRKRAQSTEKIIRYIPDKKYIEDKEIKDIEYPPFDYTIIKDTNKETVKHKQKGGGKNDNNKKTFKFESFDEKSDLYNDIVNYIINIADEYIKINRNKYIKHFNELLRPTIEESIAENGFILRGSMCYNILDKEYEPEILTYELYGPQKSFELFRELAKKLRTKFLEAQNDDYKFIEVANTDNYVFSLKSSFKIVANITQFRDDIFNSIPFTSITSQYTKHKINILDRFINSALLYNNLTLPILMHSEWPELLKEEVELNKLFPLPNKPVAKINTVSYCKDIIDIFADFGVIFTGITSYNTILSVVEPQTKFGVDYISVLCPKANINNIIAELKKTLINSTGRNVSQLNFKYTKVHSHYHLFTIRFDVFVNNIKIVELYDSSQECRPYNTFKLHGKDIMIANIHTILKNLYIDCMEGYDRIGIINHLYKTFYTYISSKGLLGIEDSAGLFKILGINCVGQQVNHSRDIKIARFKGEMKHSFRPTNNTNKDKQEDKQTKDKQEDKQNKDKQ